jgi:hypothetical protein
LAQALGRDKRSGECPFRSFRAGQLDSTITQKFGAIRAKIDNIYLLAISPRLVKQVLAVDFREELTRDFH